MKITSIKKQVKNPERVSIFVDGKYSFSLTLDEVLKYKVKNNQELDVADVKKFKKISEDGKLKAKALAWVLGRPHSIREFKDYMYRKKAEPGFTDQLIQEFTDRNYLSDETYANWLVDMRQRAGKSNRAITAELFKKGIDREIINDVLKEESEEERLKILIAKKQRLPRYRQDPEKLSLYLVRQGFSWQSVKEALNLTRLD
jgi:regulatory protein